jgi:AcrR family transcriptional regulator
MEWLIETKKRDTKLTQLVHSAVKLFVEQGIDSTTTKQIAEAADVAEGTIYRHFKSKDDMAFSIFVTHLDAFTKELDKTAAAQTTIKEKLRSLIRCYYVFFESERSLFEYILTAEHRELRKFPVNMRQPLHVIMDLLDEGIKIGQIPYQDVTFSAAYIIGIVHRVSVFRSFNRIQESLVHHVDHVTEACWRTLNGPGLSEGGREK